MAKPPLLSELEPPPRHELWRVTAKRTGASVVVRASIAYDAWRVAKLRDGDTFLHFSQVRVEPVVETERNGKRHPKAEVRRG